MVRKIQSNKPNYVNFYIFYIFHFKSSNLLSMFLSVSSQWVVLCPTQEMRIKIPSHYKIPPTSGGRSEADLWWPWWAPGPSVASREVTRRQARHRAEGASQLEPGNMWNRKCLVCQHHVCLRRLESLRTSHRSWSSCQQASIPGTERADVTCRRLPRERESINLRGLLSMLY